MKIIYMGTPEFAVPPLKTLIKAGHDVCLVVTQPDRMKDRKGVLQFTPVKRTALECGISSENIRQPEKIRNNADFTELVRSMEPDTIVVAAYGRILPLEILEIPKYGCINIHASLLPRHRGPSPIQSSIIAGDEFTGISIMQMNEGLDTGDILAVRQTKIDKKTAEQLQDELSTMGADLLKETLLAIENGTVKHIRQNDEAATYTHILTKQEGLIDYNRSPEEIERQIRGMYPWPGAYTFYRGTCLKILEAEVVQEKNSALPGTVTASGKNGIEVSAGGSTIRFTKIQPPGKKPMTAADYLLGNKIESNTIFQNGKGDS